MVGFLALLSFCFLQSFWKKGPKIVRMWENGEYLTIFGVAFVFLIIGFFVFFPIHPQSKFVRLLLGNLKTSSKYLVFAISVFCFFWIFGILILVLCYFLDLDPYQLRDWVLILWILASLYLANKVTRIWKRFFLKKG